MMYTRNIKLLNWKHIFFNKTFGSSVKSIGSIRRTSELGEIPDSGLRIRHGNRFLRTVKSKGKWVLKAVRVSLKRGVYPKRARSAD